MFKTLILQASDAAIVFALSSHPPPLEDYPIKMG
jgi:hypothetical protein